MTRFIWVRDREKVDHYINVNHIVRVTKVPAGNIKTSEHAYIVLSEVPGINLSLETYDSFDDVIQKIQVAMA